MAINFAEILEKAVQMKASDIHILVGAPPMVRVVGSIQSMEGYPELNAQECQRLIYSILFDAQRKRFEEKQELDCSVSLPNIARFRVNVLMTSRGIEAVLRVINSVIPTPEDLGFTDPLMALSKLPRGMVLVTGPTGSGKSTTLACIIDQINKNRKEHILTIEDPIEYQYKPDKCIIRQREVGTTTQSFNNALKSALREDPDVILVGELRDLETISLALTATETGHLVFATLHTTDAPQTIDRIIDVFPPHQQQQVRVQVSTALRAVVSQTLLPSKNNEGRIAAREIMMVTPAIANLIREGKTHMIYNAIETGAKNGMNTLDQALAKLVKEGKIDVEEAVSKARDPEKVRAAGTGKAY